MKHLFEEACGQRNLLSEDREWYKSLREACNKDMAFTTTPNVCIYGILIFGVMNGAFDLWNEFKTFFIENFIRHRLGLESTRISST